MRDREPAPRPICRVTTARLLAVFLVLVVGGCAHYEVNKPLIEESSEPVYRFANLDRSKNSDQLLVILTFSGGGTRAASLAYGVLKELSQTPVHWDQKQVNLLEEVDIISAVSGGSFTASYYCLFRERIFEEFQDHFLARNITGNLATTMLAPRNCFRLMSESFNNSDMAAEYYDRLLFQGANFGTLARLNQKPYLIINATDISLGAPFSFIQEQFDLLCSDLSTYPLARAVAASSAFPGLLTPITLQNFADQCGGNMPVPDHFNSIPGTQAQRGRARTAELRSYLNSTNRAFIHLIDGGVSDNLGLRAPLEAIQGHGLLSEAFNKLQVDSRLKLVLIAVDAQVSPDRGWDRMEVAPGPLNTLVPTFMVPIRNNSFESIEWFRASVDDWVARLNQAGEQRGIRDFSFNLIKVGFDQLEDPEEKDYFEQMPTNFNLSPEQVEKLTMVGGKLLRESLSFKKLLKELQPVSGTVDRPTD